LRRKKEVGNDQLAENLVFFIVVGPFSLDNFPMIGAAFGGMHPTMAIPF
jgi:hypothetical protein